MNIYGNILAHFPLNLNNICRLQFIIFITYLQYSAHYKTISSKLYIGQQMLWEKNKKQKNMGLKFINWTEMISSVLSLETLPVISFVVINNECSYCTVHHDFNFFITLNNYPSSQNE